jgi:uncharacterized membrane protein HdeD (DUF308 family)
MTNSKSPRRDAAWAIALRGLIMFATGLVALLFPETALQLVVGVGGTLLLIDGVIGLWTRISGRVTTGNVWFDYIRNILAIISGVLIIISPSVATTLTVTVLIYLVGIQAIVVGVMEALAIIREWKQLPDPAALLLISIIYVLFGIVLIASPIVTANAAVAAGGLLAVVFSLALFSVAWRLFRQPDSVVA